jgi:hypothetical protein
MPDLGCVTDYPSLVCQIYGVENRRFFVEVFPVDLVLDQHKPAFLLLISTDPEKDSHEPFLRCAETAETCFVSHHLPPCRFGISVSR